MEASELQAVNIKSFAGHIQRPAKLYSALRAFHWRGQVLILCDLTLSRFSARARLPWAS